MTSPEPTTLKPDQWNAMPPYLQGIANGMFEIKVYRPPGFPPVRTVFFTDPTNGQTTCVPDIVPVSEFRMLWQVFKSRSPNPQHVERIRIRNMLDAHDTLKNHTTRNQHKGFPCHIIGKGSSAKLAQQVLGNDTRPGGIVVAINQAVELLPVGNIDYWCVSDQLTPNNAWKPKLWLETHFDRVSHLHGLFAPWVNRHLAEAAQLASYYIPVHNRYRDFIDPNTALNLPQMVEGFQCLPTMMHWAWWMGCDPIVLWGVDQCRPIGGDYYATGDYAARDLDMRQWQMAWSLECKPVETTPNHLYAVAQTSAVAMWIQDTGVKVFNASKGLDIPFAPPIDAEAFLPEEATSIPEKEANVLALVPE